MSSPRTLERRESDVSAGGNKKRILAKTAEKALKVLERHSSGESSGCELVGTVGPCKWPQLKSVKQEPFTEAEVDAAVADTMQQGLSQLWQDRGRGRS